MHHKPGLSLQESNLKAISSSRPFDNDLLRTMWDFFHYYGWHRTYWIAYSGGLDSHVLLFLCYILRKTFSLKLCAIYINHGLNNEADKWGEHCAALCKKYAIPYHETTIQLECEKGESLENVARKKRYAALEKYIDEDDVLLTAHHQDDQAETLLIQLMRGAGLKGLSSMPIIKPFAKGLHGRPLLSFSRSLLHDYALKNNLHWIEDNTNQQDKHTRNYIRHHILPLLKKRWPSVTVTLARSATHCAQAQGLLEESARVLLSQLQGTEENTLSITKLLKLTHEQQKLVLRTWMNQLKYYAPNEKKLNTILRDVFHAGWDRQPCIKWHQTELRRYRDNLYLHKPFINSLLTSPYTWNLAIPLVIPGCGILHAHLVPNRGLSTEINEVSVQFHQKGKQIVYLEKRGRHSLKNIFQEFGVPPWLRAHIPLIFKQEIMIGIVGYYWNKNYLAKAGEAGWEILFERSPTLK